MEKELATVEKNRTITVGISKTQGEGTVHICPNAQLPHHTCLHALCDECFAIKYKYIHHADGTNDNDETTVIGTSHK